MKAHHKAWLAGGINVVLWVGIVWGVCVVARINEQYAITHNLKYSTENLLYHLIKLIGG